MVISCALLRANPTNRGRILTNRTANAKFNGSLEIILRCAGSPTGTALQYSFFPHVFTLPFSLTKFSKL